MTMRKEKETRFGARRYTKILIKKIKNGKQGMSGEVCVCVW